LTYFFHVFKPGVSERVPTIQLEIVNLVFVELIVAYREGEFGFIVCHVEVFILIYIIFGIGAKR
jgi:hypothetical protein